MPFNISDSAVFSTLILLLETIPQIAPIGEALTGTTHPDESQTPDTPLRQAHADPSPTARHPDQRGAEESGSGSRTADTPAGKRSLAASRSPPVAPSSVPAAARTCRPQKVPTPRRPHAPKSHPR